MDDGNDTRTKLLTLLNVSHLKSTKRKLKENPAAVESFEIPREKRIKLNQRRKVVLVDPAVEKGEDDARSAELAESKEQAVVEEPEVQLEIGGENFDDGPGKDTTDPFILHFGTKSIDLSESSRKGVEGGLWRRNALKPREIPRYGLTHAGVEQVLPEDHVEGLSMGPTISSESYKSFTYPKLSATFERLYNSAPTDAQLLLATMFDASVKYMDVQISNVKLTQHESTRSLATLLALNHILKIRRIILKHNDKLAAAANSQSAGPLATDEEDTFRDQGFARPSVLILAPFRNSAQGIIKLFLEHFSSLWSLDASKRESQVHNFARFTSQYSLPEGTRDRLAEAEPGAYPPDHVHTFSGNIDDNFRIGVKVTKRSVRLYEQFYGSDMIVASPLGLRLVIEKEGPDFLSSIEIAILDQMDTMTMQNWDHVQFIMSGLNKIPRESHDADFSRIKPWYLEGHAKYLRQTIFLTSYETPETRSLFNSLQNVCGRVRTTHTWAGVRVPDGIEQSYIHFEAANAQEEPDKRFDHFTKKLLPPVLKSAVQSSGTIIFIPSYFDFVRIQNWLKESEISCALISEYTSMPNIQRARQAFATGAKGFLIITERFHFFRRYKIRGTRNIIFYGPPDHAQFYTELLSYPFLNQGVEARDVTVKVLYSKYDAMRLERIVGTRSVAPLIRGEVEV